MTVLDIIGAVALVCFGVAIYFLLRIVRTLQQRINELDKCLYMQISELDREALAMRGDIARQHNEIGALTTQLNALGGVCSGLLDTQQRLDTKVADIAAEWAKIDTEYIEDRNQAAKADRLFTEGMANILNYTSNLPASSTEKRGN